MQFKQSRRSFLSTASLAGAAGVLGLSPPLAADAGLAGEPPPETPTVRITAFQSACVAPQFVAEELLRAEGFSDIRYVQTGFIGIDALGRGEVDFSLEFIPEMLPYMEAGQPLTVLAGIHGGCLELFGNERVGSIADLKGKRVAISAIDAGEHLLISIMAAYVGLDPRADIEWVVDPEDPDKGPKDLFIEGSVDALAAGPPVVQELRSRGIGQAVVRTSVDRPWSHYFCCVLAGNADYVRANPVATKRVLRAILKATDLCGSDPAWAARRLVETGFVSEKDYEAQYVLQTLQEVPYGVWRDYDPEDSVRFYALRMHELGMTRLTPSEVISDFTDWRFLEEVKRELKV